MTFPRIQSGDSEKGIFHKIEKAVKRGIDATGRTVNHLDGMDKLGKFAIGIIDGFQFVFGSILPLGNLRANIVPLNDLVGATNIISRAKEWGNKKDRPALFTVPWWKRITLTIGCTFDTIRLGASVALYSLGTWSSATCSFSFFGFVIRFFPGVGLCKDIFISISCVFSIIEYNQKLDSSRATAQLLNFKQRKFEIKAEVLEAVKAQTPDVNKLNELKNEYFKIRMVLNKEKERKDKKCEAVIRHEANSIDNAAHINKYKSKKWQIYRSALVKYENKYFKYDMRKTRLGIAYDLGKMTMITLIYTGLIITTGVLFQMAFIAAGIATGYFGFKKFLNDSYMKEYLKEPPKKSEFYKKSDFAPAA